MSSRINAVAALALTALTTAQALAFTPSQIAFTPPYDPRIKITCYTKFQFTATQFVYSERRCDAGERPLSVKVVWVPG